MKLYTVAEVLELDEKTPISSIKGTLTKVWPAKSFTVKSGPNKGSERTVQNLTLEDDTGSIDIKNWGEPLPVSDRGEEFLFESHMGKKGWNGLSVAIDTYDPDKPKTIINMTENAKIKNPDGSPTSSAKKENGAAVPLSRDPFEVAHEAMEGVRLALQCSLKIIEQMKEEFSAVTGPPTVNDAIQLAGMINYHIRDKGVLPALRPVKAGPDSRPSSKKTEEGAPDPDWPDAPPPADDDIPF